MLQELDNIKEEFNVAFDEDEIERGSKNVVPLEKYEQLRVSCLKVFLTEILTIHCTVFASQKYVGLMSRETRFEKVSPMGH